MSAGSTPQEMAIAAVNHHPSVCRQARHLRLQRAGLPRLVRDTGFAEKRDGQGAIAGIGIPPVDASQGVFQTDAALRGEPWIDRKAQQMASNAVRRGEPDRPIVVEWDQQANRFGFTFAKYADDGNVAIKTCPGQAILVRARVRTLSVKRIGHQANIR